MTVALLTQLSVCLSVGLLRLNELKVVHWGQHVTWGEVWCL